MNNCEKFMQPLKLKKLSELAITPTKNHGDAGYDLYSTEDYTLKPLERHLFKTNIALEIPEGYYGKICDRSGNAFKKGLHVMAGVIDSIYRGDVGIVLINLNFQPEEYLNSLAIMVPTGKFTGRSVEIKKHDKVAQIIFRKYEEFEFEEVDELSDSTRG